MKQFIAKRECHVFQTKDNIEKAPVIWLPDFAKESMGEKIWEKLLSDIKGTPCKLITFSVDDWNKELSPWQAPPVWKNETFAGKAPETLTWLKEAVVEVKASQTGDSIQKDYRPQHFIAGYSMAGLFALWTFYESGIFSGAASMSGSLWFPDWLSYQNACTARENSKIYISLGKKEEKTTNTVMATVGNCTRECYSVIQEDNNIRESLLEWNEGNHFSNVEERIAKGILWLLKGE